MNEINQIKCEESDKIGLCIHKYYNKSKLCIKSAMVDKEDSQIYDKNSEIYLRFPIEIADIIISYIIVNVISLAPMQINAITDTPNIWNANDRLLLCCNFRFVGPPFDYNHNDIQLIGIRIWINFGGVIPKILFAAQNMGTV